jgi:hypothetical protein
MTGAAVLCGAALADTLSLALSPGIEAAAAILAGTPAITWFAVPIGHAYPTARALRDKRKPQV